ncbi:MAG: DNA polymerase III subunit beta [Defluviitoga tunisiensis]|jgi:DNA polymerase-3 subunit beta
MGFQINTKTLRDAVELANNAVSRKTTNPILSGVKLYLEDNVLHIFTTDLQTGFHKWLKVEDADGPFSTVVEQRVFLEILSSLSSETVRIDLDGVVKLSGGNSNFKLPMMDPEEFPALTFDVSGNAILLDKNIISTMIDKVLFCVLKDSSPLSRNLNSVYWDFRRSGFLNLVTSDSFRLALSEIEVGEENLLSPFLLSLRSMEELRLILSSSKTEKIEIIQSGSQVLFNFEDDDLQLIFNTVEAEFPDYLSIIPQSFITKIKARTSDFLYIMKRMSIVSGKEEYTLLNIKDGLITCYSSSPDIGEAKEEIKVEQEGENIEIAYSPRFFREALEKIETVEFEFNISGDEQPTILKPLEDNSYMYIIMPKRKA